jgi:hypothetical protein
VKKTPKITVNSIKEIMKIKKQKEEIEEKLERYRFKICKYISAFGKEERGFSYAKRVEIDNLLYQEVLFQCFLIIIILIKKRFIAYA